MNKKYLGLLVIGSFAVAFASMTSSLAPTSDGTYSAWTPSTGTTHYTLVDESSCNGTTDYVSTATVGARDSYTVPLSSITNGAIITGISLTPCASIDRKNGSDSMSVFYRLNGVNSADSAAYTLTGSTPVTLSATNYSSLSVTKTSTTTLEIGAVLNSGTASARLSKLAVVITYIDAVPADPTNLVAQGVVSTSTSNYAHLSWNDNSSNEVGFKIERGTDGINFTQISSTTPNVTLYNDFSVTTGTTYYYRVKAYNAGGDSGYTNVSSTTIP